MNKKTNQKPAVTKQQSEFSENAGLKLYLEKIIGSSNLFDFMTYEFINLFFSNLPGAPGYFLRKISFPFIFKKSEGKNIFGKSLVVRGGKKISLDSNILIDDFSVLDARGENASIELESYVSVGRGTTIAAKNAKITLQKGCNIGSSCRIASESKIVIGESVLIAAFCYIGPGNHKKETPNSKLIESPMENKGGVVIGKNVWIGTRSTILDGVSIGDDAIIGAHSLVKNNVPAGSTVAGTPAKIIKRA